jgi:predicted small integral membrane protein
MDGFWTVARRVVSTVVWCSASYYLVVAFDNVTNPRSNWVFVKGVLSLDGVAAGSGFGWRAVDAAWFQKLAYAGVIAAETAAGVLLAIGAVSGLRTGGDHEAWLRSQRWTLVGCAAGLLIFFFGFVVVGGNWFVMYMNPRWNGMEPAFQNSVLSLLTLVVVLLVALGGRRP